MKVVVQCPECLRADVTSPRAHHIVPLDDDGVYEFKCRRGHDAMTMCTNPKFEILFDVSVAAIADGYYRDGVQSATASLERFYEYFLRVVREKHSIPDEAFAESWKHIKKQSERQLGAFIFAHLLVTSRAPRLLDNVRINFRNEVTHSGRIPTRAEAMEYAQAVLETITPTYFELRQTMRDNMSKVTFAELARRETRWNGRKHANFNSSNVVGHASLAATAVSNAVEKRVEELEGLKKWFVALPL